MAAAVVLGALIALGVAIYIGYDADRNKIGFSDGPYTEMNGWLGWIILVFAVLIVGLPWYVIRRSNVMQARQSGLVARTSPFPPPMKTCESCGSPNPPAAAFCQQCATPLIDVAPGTARLVATFGPSTGWVGKKVTRDGDHFVLEDHGPISASDVMSYDRQGHLVWASDGARAWVASLAQPKPTAGSFSIAVDSAVQSAKAALASPRPTVTTPDGAPSSATHTAAAQTTPGSPAHAAPASAPAMSAADEITKLADLHSKGSLTDEEFAALKAKLMQ